MLSLWDLTRGVAQRAFELRVVAAQARLKEVAGDPAAFATLGHWYAFRGMDLLAVDLLSRARERGAAVAPLTLARCYWNLNRNGEARREFQIALEQSNDPGERIYLAWCIQAIDTEPERTPNRKRSPLTWNGTVAPDRAISLATEGLFPVLSELAELTKHPSWNADRWYNFACAYSLASAKIAEKQQEYADRAMELLQKAVKEGWNAADHTTNDPDLDPLRDRDDFKKLLADLERKPASKPAT